VRIVEELAPLLERVGVGEDDDEPADRQGGQQGEDRHDQPAPGGAGLGEHPAHVTTTSSSVTGSTLAASATAPPMSRPTRSRSASARSRMPWMRPPHTTTMRSASASTSSNSDELISTATPSPRLATIWRWMYWIDPTSSPRVGW